MNAISQPIRLAPLHQTAPAIARDAAAQTLFNRLLAELTGDAEDYDDHELAQMAMEDDDPLAINAAAIRLLRQHGAFPAREFVAYQFGKMTQAGWCAGIAELVVGVVVQHYADCADEHQTLGEHVAVVLENVA